MPLEQLAELEASDPATAGLENVEGLLRALAPFAARDLALAAEGLKDSAQAFQNAWRGIVLDVAKKHTAEIQAARPRLLNAFHKRLRLLKLTHALATWFAAQGRTDTPDPDALAPAIEGMEKLKDSVFDRWETAEDLEELAARDYPFTTTDLEQLLPHRQPPASWYAENDKPF